MPFTSEFELISDPNQQDIELMLIGFSTIYYTFYSIICLARKDNVWCWHISKYAVVIYR